MVSPGHVEDSAAVIVGASTAGLHAAYLLARGGARVRLFDAAQHLGLPARTLIITGCLNEVLGYEPAPAVLNRTHVIELFSPHRSLSIRLHEPDLIVERQELIRLLAERAASAGAEIRLGYRLVGLEPGSGGLELSLERVDGGPPERLRTRTLIGADGVAGSVAGSAGWPRPPTVWLRQATVALAAGADPDTTQVWFDPSCTPYFYWLEPESGERAVVGLIAEEERQAREGLDRFLAGRNLRPLGYQAARVPVYSRGPAPYKEMGGSRVFLVGDAAAQVKVSTVGGVVTGLRGARALARAILHGTGYPRELRALKRELELHLVMRRVLNRFTPGDYDDLLDLAGHRARGALAAYSRDEAGRVLLSALVAEPRLLLLGARSLLRSRSTGRG